MTSPTTPKGKAVTYQAATTPTTTRFSNTHASRSSPHYATTRRHSLYGVEDRIIIDPGSRIWKAGFSGEGKPRDVFYPLGPTGAPLWSLRRALVVSEQEEEDKMLEINLRCCLRSVFHDSLLTDPKARKVIIVENPLLPLYIKEIIARVLFENQVPSVSFAPSHLLALLSIGRITGMVLDCGHLESVALPIFAARPLYPQLKTTPLAGSRLTSHIRALLLMFGTYIAPPASLSAAVNIPSGNRATRVPQEVLTDALVEEVKTRCCFVGEALTDSRDVHGETPSDDALSGMDIPSSDAQSESESSRNGIGVESGVPSQQLASVSQNQPGHPPDISRSESHLQALSLLYTRHSTATDLHMRVAPPISQQAGTGHGILVIPGWVRERAAEVLFEGGDVDESSVAEVILDAFLKIPVDLRKTLASSILVSGGTAMLPGFVPRLRAEILRAISPPSATSGHKRRPPRYDKYVYLRSLIPYFAILNNPSPPPPQSDRAKVNAGKAPAFTPATMAWVGGSVAGSLKSGGIEVSREKWDEEGNRNETGDNMDESTDDTPRNATANILPDWTRTPLGAGAPVANIHLLSCIQDDST